MQLWKKIILSIILGILCGYYLAFDKIIFVCSIIEIQFMNLIKLLSGPVIFFSILNGICTSRQSGTNLKRIIIQSVIMFLITTIFAICLGLLFAYIFKPGTNIIINSNDIQHTNTIKTKSLFNIPNNIISPFLEMNLIQILLCAILLGVFILKNHDNNKTLINIIISLNDIFINILSFITQYSYILVFAAITKIVALDGFGVFIALIKLIYTVLLAQICQYIILILLIKICGKISPMPFIYKSIPYQILSFATSSTKAALSKTIEICIKKLGVSRSSASLLLPLGASINMDGTATYMGVTAIFFSQLHNIDLTMINILNIIFMSTIGSIGCAGIPSGSFIMLASILESAGIPVIKISIILGIDRLLDMSRTVINITGDAAITLIIDSREKTLNKKIYYDNSLN